MTAQELWGFRVGDACRVPAYQISRGKEREVWVLGEVVRISGTSPITRDMPQLCVRVVMDASEPEVTDQVWVDQPKNIRRPDETGEVPQ